MRDDSSETLTYKPEQVRKSFYCNLRSEWSAEARTWTRRHTHNETCSANHYAEFANPKNPKMETRDLS